MTAESIIDKAVFDLNYLASTFTANLRPSPFICLLLKLLQLQPEKEIILEYLRAEEFKSVYFSWHIILRKKEKKKKEKTEAGASSPY